MGEVRVQMKRGVNVRRKEDCNECVVAVVCDNDNLRSFWKARGREVRREWSSVFSVDMSVGARGRWERLTVRMNELDGQGSCVRGRRGRIGYQLFYLRI